MDRQQCKIKHRNELTVILKKIKLLYGITIPNH